MAANADGRLEIFGLGGDSATVFHNWQESPGGGWSGWYPLGVPASSDGNGSGSEPSSSGLTSQPPPTSAPTPTIPPVVSASATDCNDLSGIWTDTAYKQYSLYQTGSAATGSFTVYQPGCGYFSGSVQGQETIPGSFSLTLTGPSSDACGYPITYPQATASVTISSCSQVQANISGAGAGGAGFVGSGSGSTSSGTVTWSRSSAPPGLSVSVDLNSGKVNTSLTGQNKTDTLSVQINGAGQSKALAAHGNAQTGSSFNDSLQRTSLSPGQYNSVVATWGNTSVTVPVSFYVIGYTRFSQYNFAYESQCPANLQKAWIFYKIDANSCYWKTALLGSKFISQTEENGTGVSNANGILKGYHAGAASSCPIPPAANSDGSNTFFSVDSGGAAIAKITGRCNSVLSDATGLTNSLVNDNPQAGSVATNPTSNTPTYSCSDQILLIDQADNNDPLGICSVQDQYPACSGGFGSNYGNTVAHIDMFNSAQTCDPNAVGDYGARVAIKLK